MENPSPRLSSQDMAACPPPHLPAQGAQTPALTRSGQGTPTPATQVMQWDDASFPLSHASPHSAPSHGDIAVPSGTPSSALIYLPLAPGKLMCCPPQPVTRPPWPWSLTCHMDENRGGGGKSPSTPERDAEDRRAARRPGPAATQRVQRQEHTSPRATEKGQRPSLNSPGKAHTLGSTFCTAS